MQMKKSQLDVRIVFGWFFFSGMAALIYQVVWARQLELIFGSTLFAVSAILSAFMGGLALGSFYIGKLADKQGNPLKLYIFLELGIGIYAVLTPYLFKILPLLEKSIPQLYSSGGLSFSLVSVVFSFIVLIIPTFLMGGTLPTATRFIVGNYHELGLKIGRLYFINTIGAATGAFLAGFILIAAFGLAMTTLCAALFNWLIAFTAFLVLKRTAGAGASQQETLASVETSSAAVTESEERVPRAQGVVLLISYGLAGFAALGLEVLWTRTLVMFIGSTVYAFSLMLMAILAGIAVGSLVMAPRTDVSRNRLLVYFAVIEIALGLSVLAITPLLGQYPLLFLKLFVSYESSFWLLQILEFFIVFLTLLVPTTLMGAAFPVISKLYTADVKHLAGRIGDIYAVNTFGCVLGPLAVSFLLIPLLGIQHSITVAAGLYLVVGLMAVSLSTRMKTRTKAAAGLMLTAILLFSIAIPPWTPELISSGVYFHADSYNDDDSMAGARSIMLSKKVVFYKEGQLATVGVFDHPSGSRILTINGKVDASSMADMGTQLFIAHMPMLLHPDPKKAFMVGLGSGSTLGAMALHPEVESIDAVEIEPAVVEAADYMTDSNHGVVHDPKVKMIVSDGRNFILNSQKSYDVIVAEPSNMWVSSSSNLFSREVFELYRSRLAEGGLVGQWMYIYRIDPDDLKTMINTFRSVFPHMTVWGNYFYPDILLIGSLKPLQIDFQNFSQRVQQPRVKQDLARIDADDPLTLLGYFQMDEDSVASYASGGSVNTDDAPRLEFSAPRNMYRRTTESNLESMKPYQSSLVPLLKNTSDPEIVKRLENNYRAKSDIIDGVVLNGRGQAVEAVDDWESALKQDPDNLSLRKQLADTYMSIGNWYNANKEFEAALTYYQRVVELQPPNASAYSYLGQISQSLGRKDDAVKFLGMAVQLKPADAGLRYEIARGLLATGAFEPAVSHLTEAIRLNPAMTTAYASRAYALQEIGKYTEALADYNQALKLDPSFTRLLINRASLYYATGDLASALADLNTVLQKEDVADAYDLRSLVLLQQKEYDKALKDSEKASIMDAWMPMPYYRRGAILQEMGDKSGAIDAYQRFLIMPDADQGLKDSARQEIARLKG